MGDTESGKPPARAPVKRSSVWIAAGAVGLFVLAIYFGHGDAPPAPVAPNAATDEQTGLVGQNIDPSQAYAYCHTINLEYRADEMAAFSDEDLATGVCLTEKLSLAAVENNWSDGDKNECFLAASAMETSYSSRLPHGDIEAAKKNC